MFAYVLLGSFLGLLVGTNLSILIMSLLRIAKQADTQLGMEG